MDGRADFYSWASSHTRKLRVRAADARRSFHRPEHAGRIGALPEGELEHGKRSAKWRAERRRWRLLVRLLNWETDQFARQVRAILRERKRQQKAAKRVPLTTTMFVDTLNGVRMC